MKLSRFFVGVLALLSTFGALADFVGLTDAEFLPHYTRQHTPMWCWAASSQMVLSYQGVKIPQEKIVERVTGTLGATPGSINDMINAANGVFSTEGGKAVVSGQYIYGAPLPTVLYNQLKNKRPVILNYLSPGNNVGHAIVVTGIEASIASGQVMVSSIHVFDPFAYHINYDGWGKTTYTFDPELTTKTYPLTQQPNGVFIPPGVITGVILVEGSKL